MERNEKTDDLGYLGFITRLPERSKLYSRLMKREIDACDSNDNISHIFSVIPNGHRLKKTAYKRWTDIIKEKLRKAAQDDFAEIFRSIPAEALPLRNMMAREWLARTSEHDDLKEIYYSVIDVQRGLFLVDKDLVIEVWQKMAKAAELKGFILQKAMFIDKDGVRHEWSRVAPALR